VRALRLQLLLGLSWSPVLDEIAQQENPHARPNPSTEALRRVAACLNCRLPKYRSHLLGDQCTAGIVIRTRSVTPDHTNFTMLVHLCNAISTLMAYFSSAAIAWHELEICLTKSFSYIYVCNTNGCNPFKKPLYLQNKLLLGDHTGKHRLKRVPAMVMLLGSDSHPTVFNLIGINQILPI
jgi:hypothetical protein